MIYILQPTEYIPNIKAYDNGGATIDRYTVFIDDSSYSFSVNPEVFNRKGVGTDKQLGKQVPVIDLPYIVRIAIAKRIKENK